MESTIGENLAKIRREAQLTQEHLAERSGVSIEVIQKLEQGRRKGARIPTLNKLARALGVPTSALFGDTAAAAADREPDAQPLSLVGVRQVLTPAAGLDGTRLVTRPSATPPTQDGVRRAVLAANTVYHANDYAEAIRIVPSVLTDAGALVDATDGDARIEAHVLASQAHTLAGRLLIQLRQLDLAHLALTRALDHARHGGDHVTGAAVVAPMCWLLLRQGRLAESEQLAVQTADQVEPRLSTATPAELASWGYLLMKAASAAARDARLDDATNMLDLAMAGAHRLGGQPVPSADVLGCDFSVEGVQQMRVEASVIAGQPDQALALAREVHRSAGVTPSSRQRHRLDVAWSYMETSRYAEATEVLQDLAARAPAWLRQQKYARDIVQSIAAGRRRAMTSELAELAELVGCSR
ncbi:helix-turn-helix domain-containing protein [Micromonospora yangpuensis]|uniref:Transcriptional regulator, contains XRE-family HTH domain n=1 Tax=Micromonospora yangpuensis TaxID=683228 RepID=A0A1C6VF72_9ACTN|nr:helix-turn-helix transcriptional regulator [Micromonospora yangpuensis]GGM14508.1 hypothetical protein GCM10012279_35750 [Micromonospora yangpuensis]SCL64684.1 Transcriptional regulator, contains XRE-family HTH domain [Micromonospora yangpuensis]